MRKLGGNVSFELNHLLSETDTFIYNRARYFLSLKPAVNMRFGQNLWKSLKTIKSNCEKPLSPSPNPSPGLLLATGMVCYILHHSCLGQSHVSSF